MKKWSLFFLVITMTVFVGCKREVFPSEEVSGKDYFPLSEGKYIEYAVDSILYNTFTKDTERVHCEFRDEITSQFPDNEGRNSYLIERSIRYDSNAAWIGYQTNYVTPTDFKIEEVENNLRFIKLVFPVKTNTTWKGNVYIPAFTSSLDSLKWYDDWDYNYYYINQEFNNGLSVFPATVTVAYHHLTNDSTSTTQYNDFTNYKEVYSKNIGLVFRELTHWEFQPTEGFRNGFSVVLRATKHN